ncbi:hypothetical protein [Brunnivagina elsteri]|uniref:Alpha/beta hydrolase n=1 Tax=Brunnivagina elsteri CCALA 953 TaxID=987040 RepID=A0A2A2TQ05_9CYAN|nr:hypothetical protein [Calothrix elsteri]PAX60601.1 hypothetical protein CK510_01060 [Calothrix elsteri CCALA 953]
MLQSMFSSKLSSRTSNLIFLALGVSATLTATLTMTSPASAQSSTIIYQRTTTYDNYHEPSVIYQHTQTSERDFQPYVTNFIYGSPISTPFPVNPYNGQIIQGNDNFYHNSYSQRRVIIQPRVRRYIKDTTLINPIFFNPNIRNSTIINPRILNPHHHYYGNPVHRNSGTIFIQP